MSCAELVERKIGAPGLAKRIFEKYDKDGSGGIDRQEFKEMCYDLGYFLNDTETDLAFRRIDMCEPKYISYLN
jgi:Ca2+-binding EF-hand superfamily protein